MTENDPTPRAELPRPTSPPAGGARYAYPVMLDVSDRLAVVVGGGAVAARKTAGLLAAGAGRVRCVAPRFRGSWDDFPAGVERVVGEYEPRHLEGARLVFAATDVAAVNDAVVRDAHSRGILVARADGGGELSGDFTTPALFRAAAVTVTVSAGSPALAALIRDGLAARWDERWSKMADALRVLRPAVLRAGVMEPNRRAALFRDLATEAAIEVLSASGLDALSDWLAPRYPELRAAEEGIGKVETGTAPL